MSKVTKKNYKVVDIPMNRPDGSLPFALYSPESDGKVQWLCDYDKDKQITSVFTYQDGHDKDRRVFHLPNMKTAEDTRDQLLAANWKPLKTPTVSYSYSDGKGNESDSTTMNRAQRRYLAKQSRRAQKHNPFNH